MTDAEAGKDRLKIMVSVTDPDEAVEAIKGGADIVDVKNPREGALGANRPWIIHRIREAAEDGFEISATIGDMPNLPGTASLAAFGAAALGADYVKIGMLGPKTADEALEIAHVVSRTFREFGLKTKLVVAGYADYRRHGCVNPLDLPRVASEVGAWGVLIDVREKGSKGLLDHLSFDELKCFVEKAHGSDLKVALAGSLGREDLQTMLRLGADIIGVRRKVCTSRNGEPRVDRQRVEEIVEVIYPKGRSV